VFEKDSTGKQECIRYVDSDYVGNLDKRRSIMGYVFTLAKHRCVGALFYNLLSHYLLWRPSIWS